MTTDTQPNPDAINWTYSHEDGLPHDTGDGDHAGAPRVHLSGDPQSGWIGDIHDGQNHVSASTENVDALGALDHLHKAWQEAGNAAIEGWDEIKAAFKVVIADAKQKAQTAVAAGQAAAKAAEQSVKQGDQQQN